ncbi:MAG: peroxide stress protein YaaA [Nocardioidaceae bacterium]
MLILLPPSEGKRPPGRGKPLDLHGLGFPELTDDRTAVLDALVELCTTDEPSAAAAVLGLGSTQVGEVAAGAHLLEAPTARADRVYSGVLYEALDVASLDTAARRRATSWLAVTSGLFGLLRPDDRIPAYRLSGDVSLPGVGTVSTWWGSRLDATVRAAAGCGLVVDLRSSAYASFWRPGPDLLRRVVTVRVLHEVDGTRKVVSHFNKATKGRLVRAVLQDGTAPRSPARFADHLTSLGWTVEEGPAGRHGTGLDVVVGDL